MRFRHLVNTVGLVLGGVVLSSQPADGADAVDGFYETTNNPKARQIVDVHGKKWKVGPRLSFTNRFVEIASGDNWNQHFQLSVSFPKKGDGAIPPLQRRPIFLMHSDEQESWNVLLKIDDQWRCLELISSNVEGAVGAWLPVSGREDAERIARHFSVKLFLRQHPGHRVAVKFTATTNTVPLGNPVNVKMTLRNVGTNVVRFHRGLHRETSLRYSFLLSHEFETRGGKNQMGFGGFEVTKSLKPAEEFVEEVELTDWFKLTQPGRYWVKGMYDLILLDPSNSDRTLWIDTVSNEFSFVIGTPKDQR